MAFRVECPAVLLKIQPRTDSLAFKEDSQAGVTLLGKAKSDDLLFRHPWHALKSQADNVSLAAIVPRSPVGHVSIQHGQALTVNGD